MVIQQPKYKVIGDDIMEFKEKIMEEFLKLIKIPSPSFNEREIADYLKKRLEALGLEVYEDNAGKEIGGNTGNIIGVLRAPEKKKVMFNCHMDVVPPCEDVNPIIEGDIIKTDGTTTLGSDDKAGIAVILNMLDYIKENKLDHPEIYVVFTVAEEQGCLGVANSEIGRYDIDYGFILDGFVDPGIIAYGEPELNIFEAVVTGKTGHLFFDVENGVNAFKIAADAMANVRVGKIDEDTVANAVYGEGDWTIGAIPGKVTVEYIIASYNDTILNDEIENFKNAFKQAAAKHGGIAEVNHLATIPKFVLDDNSEYIKALGSAAKESDLNFEKIRPVFITDAGTFNKLGVPTVVLGTGVRNAHTVKEYARISHILENAKFIIKIVEKISEI